MNQVTRLFWTLLFLLFNTFLAFPENLDTICTPLYKMLRKDFPILRKQKLTCDSIRIDKKNKILHIYPCKHFEDVPYREDFVRQMYDSVRAKLPNMYKDYMVKIYVNDYELSELVPNCLRTELKLDKNRMEKRWIYEHPIVSNLDANHQPSKGLLNNHLAIWPSHGNYFEKRDQEWVWQRPRLFTVTEDTYTLGYVLPYLVPMLENAGAYVFLPRERDTQTNETIVDNDDRDFLYEECHGKKVRWRRGDTTGFGNSKDIYTEGENPFCYGSYRQIKCDKEGSAYANWTPDIPEEGDYAVYVSYHTLPHNESSTDAHYTVYHTGGATQFIVNQQMGSNTWIYLGTFHFDEGINPNMGRVELTNQGDINKYITADAVRFGGGFGNIARTDADSIVTLSNKPRYLEGAVTWLQWAGYADSIYNRNGDPEEYKDDYMSRGFWVNALTGGSNKLPDKAGKNVPIEMAMGFHTDAGQLFNDSIFGTLLIYRTLNVDHTDYANGQDRIVSRDLADLMQTQIVDDIRQTFRSDWTRRRMNDASYHEAREPEVPTVLLELLSHQNFTDMRYGLDPHFRFLVSRAVYKAILKFLSYQQYREYVVQPLPVKKFSAEFYNEENNVVRLSWVAQGDSLEPSASADHYILYTSVDNGGWDNGIRVNTPSAMVTLDANRLYRFKVTAVNDGGESFPSEVISAGYVPGTDKYALVINGFHRVSAPEWFETPGYSGFLDFIDQGVPDHYDLSYIGAQYAFNKRNPYKNNNSPGHGGSYAIFENEKIAGNLFDYPAIHGKAIMEAGYSFVSCSDEAIVEGEFSLHGYHFVDLIYGEEKTTTVGYESRYSIFPEELRKVLTHYLFRQNGNLYVSGAYLGSDLYERDSCDEDAIRFAERVLRYQLAESVVKTRPILSNYFSPFKEFQHRYYHYCNTLNEHQYAVESPDAIDTSNGSKIIFSFEGSNLPSAVGYKGRYKTVISSIPFESLDTEKEQKTLMQEIIHFFENK